MIMSSPITFQEGTVERTLTRKNPPPNTMFMKPSCFGTEMNKYIALKHGNYFSHYGKIVNETNCGMRIFRKFNKFRGKFTSSVCQYHVTISS